MPQKKPQTKLSKPAKTTKTTKTAARPRPSVAKTTKKAVSRPASTARQPKKRKYVAAVGVFVAVLALLAPFAYARMHASSTKLTAAGPLSYQLSVYQQSIIKQNRPAPTFAALQYAYVSSVYADALKTSDQSAALQAAGKMLVNLYPDKTTDINQHIKSMVTSNYLDTTSSLPDDVTAVVTKYTTRYAHDGHDLAWDGVIPTGPGKWIKVNAFDPLTPEAGKWQRWNVTKAITVPPPPVVGSAEDAQQIAIVQQAVATRTGEDVNIINFWAGGLGTETPSGIWQNQLYRTINSALPSDAGAADKSYSLIQKNLTQSISDAFMECWKVKYTYWTARPSMRIPNLVTAMNDPRFPSYISGHSTISKAAADVLSVMLPKYASQWEAMAVQARDSRLKAGIHFQIDNTVGFQVGTNVATQSEQALQLKEIKL